jgi:hypothetical protein
LARLYLLLLLLLSLRLLSLKLPALRLRELLLVFDVRGGDGGMDGRRGKVGATTARGGGRVVALDARTGAIVREVGERGGRVVVLVVVLVLAEGGGTRVERTGGVGCLARRRGRRGQVRGDHSLVLRRPGGRWETWEVRGTEKGQKAEVLGR